MINHDQSTISGLSKTYEPVDKEISCDIDVVTIRTMEAKGLNVEPSNEAVLILHRQGFDPAIATGPFITTANDIFGIFLFFYVAKLILGF